MQIVLEIPEWFKKMIDKGEAPLEFPLFLAYGIQQGTPLPKGHGRLFDERDIVNGNYEVIGNRIYELEPIIEADRSDT